MKFFIPFADNEAHAEQIYGYIKDFLQNQYSRYSSNERIYRIRFTRDGVRYQETVGDPSQVNGEIIVAILRCNGIFHICTHTRGVEGGEPMLASADYIEYFDD